MFIIEISIIVLIALSSLNVVRILSWDDLQADDYVYILCHLVIILILCSSIYLGVFE